MTRPPALPLDGAPDPEAARRGYERLVAAGLLEEQLRSDPDLAAITRVALFHAPYLTSLAARRIGRLLEAAADPYLRREKPLAVFQKEILSRVSPDLDEGELLARLRDVRAREFLRLGARECGLGNRPEVWRELAHLASACLDAALAYYRPRLEAQHGPALEETPAGPRPARLVIFGMGKLGGEELNFSSDIDLIYVYGTDQGAAGEISLHELFDKLARRVNRAIGEVTEDGLVFRVDMRLRPEGQKGPLVNALPALEQYYESWGRPWERQAWLKARPVAGDRELGAEVLAVLEPFVYPRTTGADVVQKVQEQSRKVKASLSKESIQTGFDVKLGEGGIREIEFFVQALQLVHAGKVPQLRERSTRGALERLLFAGLISAREWQELLEAYELLRHVEHVLQLEEGLQTQRLPTDRDRLAVLAARLGCADVAELVGLLAHHTRRVSAIFETLGGGESSLRPEVAILFEPDPEPIAVESALLALGFRDIRGARYELELLSQKPHSPFSPRAQGAPARVAPILLQEVAASPDPDQALRFVTDLVGRRGAWSALWRLLDENRPLTRLVASLFGTSEFLARTFVDHPELVDMLLLAGRAGPRDSGELRRAVWERLAELDPDDTEGAWNALRRLKQEELLRIGLADIAGELDPEQVSEQLSGLADVCVSQTFERVRADLLRREETLAPMAVLALGKLGGQEMGYASDLDLVFVHAGGVDDHEPMARLAQRFVSALGAHLVEGRLYEVDTRLRPSGNQGMLVSSLEAWRRYHRESARLWERQALLKARAVAGDPALCRRVEAEIQEHLFGAPADEDAVAESIRDMRARIEKERAREDAETFDFKAGHGGLLDVEFAVQYLQLVHGPAVPGLRARNTLFAVDQAAAAGVLDADDASVLRGGYLFLRYLENRMRIVHDRPAQELPREPAELEKLARRMGHPSAQALKSTYLRWTQAIRACYVKLLKG